MNASNRSTPLLCKKKRGVVVNYSWLKLALMYSMMGWFWALSMNFHYSFRMIVISIFFFSFHCFLLWLFQHQKFVICGKANDECVQAASRRRDSSRCWWQTVTDRRHRDRLAMACNPHVVNSTHILAPNFWF